MSTHLHADHLSTFKVQTWPPPRDLGQALERNVMIAGARLQLRFGERVASLAVNDLWSTCCELLLQAQLIRESRLDRFVVDVEHIFDLRYDSGLVLCTFSQEHVFEVDQQGFALSLERVVTEIFDGTSCPGLMLIAAKWAASNIRAQPYSFRFSDSVLT
jgi:hypothetical protein